MKQRSSNCNLYNKWRDLEVGKYLWNIAARELWKGCKDVWVVMERCNWEHAVVRFKNEWLHFCLPAFYVHPNITLLFLLYFLLAYLDKILWVWKLLGISKIPKQLLELYNNLLCELQCSFFLSEYIDKITVNNHVYYM